MKQAWFGFLALLSAMLFVWMGTELMSPQNERVEIRQTTDGSMIQWDYHRVAIEWRSAQVFAAPDVMVPVSSIHSALGGTFASGKLSTSAAGSLADYLLILIPMPWLMYLASILTIIWSGMKLMDLHSAYFMRRTACKTCGRESRVGLSACPVCGELTPLAETQLA
jgi:hypothetical protein